MNKRTIYLEDAVDALNALFMKQIIQFGYKSYEDADDKIKLVCDGIMDSINEIQNLTWIPYEDCLQNLTLVDADELKNKAWNADTQFGQIQVVSLDDIQTAHSIELWEKKGIWMNKGRGELECSVCRNIINVEKEILISSASIKYCPHCGSYNVKIIKEFMHSRDSKTQKMEED